VVERLKIDLPRPRAIELMSASRFGEYTLQIRSLLASAGKDEVPGSSQDQRSAHR